MLALPAAGLGIVDRGHLYGTVPSEIRYDGGLPVRGVLVSSDSVEENHRLLGGSRGRGGPLNVEEGACDTDVERGWARRWSHGKRWPGVTSGRKAVQGARKVRRWISRVAWPVSEADTLSDCLKC